MVGFVLNELLETMKVLRSAVTDGLQLELQLKSNMIAESQKESQGSRVDGFEKELGRMERRFGKEIVSLSTQHKSEDCGCGCGCDCEGIMSEFRNICGCPEDVEHGM
jgi:hypothetical protein